MMNEIAYEFDSNGLWVGVIKCQPCKIRLGHWLLPRNATWVKPPERIDGKQIVWSGVKWSYKDVPREAIVVETAIQKTAEIREDPDLLRLMLQNLRSEMEISIVKAVSERVENVASRVGLIERERADLVHLISNLKAENQSLRNQILSLVSEIGVIGSRIENLVNSSNRFIDELERMRETISVKKLDASNLPVALESKKSKIKFWG